MRAGSYKCVCRPGYYFPLQNATTKYFSGITMENSFLDDYYNKSSMNSSDFQCLPCLPGCELCDDKTLCMAEYNILLRGIPLGIQSFCITVSLVIGVAVLRLRKTKVSKNVATSIILSISSSIFHLIIRRSAVCSNNPLCLHYRNKSRVLFCLKYVFCMVNNTN